MRLPGVRRTRARLKVVITPLERGAVTVFHDTTWHLHTDHLSYRREMDGPKLVEELHDAGFLVVTIERDCGVSPVQWPPGGICLSPEANGET